MVLVFNCVNFSLISSSSWEILVGIYANFVEDCVLRCLAWLETREHRAVPDPRPALLQHLVLYCMELHHCILSRSPAKTAALSLTAVTILCSTRQPLVFSRWRLAKNRTNTKKQKVKTILHTPAVNLYSLQHDMKSWHQRIQGTNYS